MPAIKTIFAEKVLGFRGQETIEVTVTDEQGLAGGFRVPFGKSEGMFEAAYLKPDDAVRACNQTIAPMLRGFDPGNQETIDRTMIAADGTPQKQNLGGNGMLGVSIACSRLAAHEREIPLYRHFANLYGRDADVHGHFPKVLYNIVEGGLHAENDLVFQEHLVIPAVDSLAAQIEMLKSFSQAFVQETEKRGWKEAYGYEGGWAGATNVSGTVIDKEYAMFALLDSVRNQGVFEVEFGLDVAANNIKEFDPQSYYDAYVRLAREYPLTYLEDGFAEQGQDDWWKKIYADISQKTLIVGDDLTVTNPRKLDAYVGTNAINAMIIKPDQVGTLTETFEAIQKARKQGWKITVSHRSQETTDDYLADLAIAVGADFVKFGAFTQGERLAKYNRLLEIEQ